MKRRAHVGVTTNREMTASGFNKAGNDSATSGKPDDTRLARPFRFRQFAVAQDRCAMKVGTDGVLLGAWASTGTAEADSCRRILDIGTGTGLIALMMAQRCAGACVVGIDIVAEACEQACENVAASPFSNRVEIVNTSLQHYDAEPRSFDAIVSNPPFFENSLKNPNRERSVARHTDTLSCTDLFRGVDRLLADNGVFCVIIPTENLNVFRSEAAIFGFYVNEEIKIQTTPAKQPKRCLLSFLRYRPACPVQQTVALTNADGSRSEWYQHLTQDFYL